MLDTTTQAAKSHPLPMGSLRRASFDSRRANRLERANFTRDARLLDASIAGVVLSFNPRDGEMRDKAEQAWKSIRALLANHLFTEGNGVLPWSAGSSMGSPTACHIIEKRYSELRALARTVASVSFEDGADVEISNAGKALCRLAVKLDDLIDGTERRLMNKLRQYVFSSAEKTRWSE
jgi:hypothetical protein